MRRRTLAALLVLVALLGAVGAAGIGSSGGTLREHWTSDTARSNTVNHHAVGVGPDGATVVAPVSEVPSAGVPITNDSCALVRLDPEDGSTRWQHGLHAADCFTHALTEPAVADVDGDGRLEAAVASTEEALVVHDAGSGHKEWQVPLSTYGYGRPTVGNLTAAAGPEVVAVDIGGGVLVAHGNGTVAWRANLTAAGQPTPNVLVAPVVEDIDGDGTTELLVGSDDGVVRFGPDGAVERAWDGSAEFLVTAPAADGAGHDIFTAGPGTVAAFDDRTGAREWQRDIDGARLHTVTDGDGDSRHEVYLGVADGRVLALDASTGEREWATRIAGDVAFVPAPILGDVTGDGRPEVVATTSAGRVLVLDGRTGAELAAFERSVPVWTVPAVADLDGDGRAAVVVRYGDGRVVALEYVGGVMRFLS